MAVKLINSRTPEEIKRWISNRVKCETCPQDGLYGCEYGERTKDCQMCIDAIAYVDRLEAAQPKWISVEKALPEMFVSVQVFMTDAGPFPSVREGYHVGNGRFCIPALGGWHPVSHWKPFDEPPKEETNETTD